MPSRVSKSKRSGNKNKKKNRYQTNEVPIRVIYVTQLEKCPFRVTSESLKTFFEEVGTVERVDFISQYKHKFAFITYQKSEDATKALAFPIFHQYVKIRKADPRHQPESHTNDHNSETTNMFSLLILNNDCLLYLFSFLNPVDAVNLAETDDRIRLVSQIHFRKYSHFDTKIVTVESLSVIGRVYEHIGPWITSLKFDALLLPKIISIDKMIEIFAEYCLNVETLNISNAAYRKKPNAFVKQLFAKIKRVEMYNCGFHDSMLKELFSGSTSDLEHLIFEESDFISGSCISRLTNLKTLKFRTCSNLNACKLNEGLRSNSRLTEFELSKSDVAFDFETVKFFPNLNTLTIDMYEYRNIDKLLELDQLKKLKIICFQSIQIDSFLFKLGQKDMLEEFYINFLEIGEQTIDAFKSFKKLKKFNLISPSHEMKAKLFERLPIVLPQLTNLNYHDYSITMDYILLTIRKLKHLEHFDISSYGCLTMDEISKIVDTLKTDLNRPLLHITVSNDCFWPDSIWKKEPIIRDNKHILEIDLKTSSDDIHDYETEESESHDSSDDDDDSDDSRGDRIINLVDWVLDIFLNDHMDFGYNLQNEVD